ncbi:MAG: hypothetical protein ACPHL3_02910 [Paracoccaceae bacterium]
MIEIDVLLQNRSLELYDGSTSIALDLSKKNKNKTTVFIRDKRPDTVAGIKLEEYNALLEAADCVASVCMLNDDAIKVLIAMYPSAPKYVLVRLAPRWAWILGFVGLMRRIIKGLVRIEGVTTLPKISGKGRTYWLVLEQSGTDIHQIPVIPKTLGISSFLQWLKDEKVNYIVLRFFERLPELHREAGDLDLLISDEDRPKVYDYLRFVHNQASEDAGDTRVGLHSVSGEPGMIPYYPPPLARGMLERATSGPAESLVPCPKDELLSMMYHALYHTKKGYASGIPSSLSKHTDSHPENDYAGLIMKKAHTLGVDVGKTMEDMDVFLAREGWRPKIDTLAKIAETNAWVSDRFFANTLKRAEGLAVLVIREWVVRANLEDDFIDEISKEGFVVLQNKTLSTVQKQYVRDHLRGGTWGSDENGDTEFWQPAAVLVLVDPQCASLPTSYAVGFEHYRIRKLKERLRKKFDDKRSSVHSTDNTLESWDYIEACFPDEIKQIQKQVLRYNRSSILALTRQLLKPTYLRHSLKHSLRSFLIRKFLT